MPFNTIFGWIIKKRIHQIELFKKYPIEVQNELLEHLIAAGQKCAYGQTYNFSKVHYYQDFSAHVPLSDYDSLKPWIKRATDGELNVLWPGETKWFAKSSGTTADKSKYIPVTKESLEDCHYKGGKDLLALYYENNPQSKIYNGKHLVIGGSAEQHVIRPDSYTGDLSSIILKNLPWWVEIKRIPSKETALLSVWEEKIERLADETLHQDVTSISGVPSWTLVLLNRILQKSGKNNIKEVWPNLELFMHGGVSFLPYQKEFDAIIAKENMHYIESYNASEGFFGIQDTFDGDLLLMLDYGVFFEFIPMKEFDGINSKTVLPLSEVEENVNYALVISTNGGLWRYIVGDTIAFTLTNPYRFKVTGRVKHYINVFGEELMVDNADNAIRFACEQSNATIKDYTACPIYMQNGTAGGHEWFIEFSKKPEDIEHFTALLDAGLKNVNSDYEAKRTGDMSLGMPKVHVLREGVFETWLKEKGKLGGQHKVPRLVNNREIAEELLKIGI